MSIASSGFFPLDINVSISNPPVSNPSNEIPPCRVPTIRSLEAFFHPRAVAVVGACEQPHSAGRTVLSNLLANPFGGCVYPVNSTRKSVLGVRAFPDVAALPEPVDLVVITTATADAADILEQCGKQGVTAALVLSGGLEPQALATARKTGMKIIGPNCLGLMNPVSGLNATLINKIAPLGSVAFVSECGALGASILDWSLRENVGLRAFVSLGSMSDVGWGDLVDYFGNDPQTSSILLQMESVGDAESFMSAARAVAFDKPVIVIKGGKTGESDQVFDAAIERVGVLRVERIAELFSVASVLSKQPHPQGNRLTIITNAHGSGVLAADALVEGGGKLSELNGETTNKLKEFLPADEKHDNPIELLSGDNSDCYAEILQAAANDPNCDGILVIHAPNHATDPTKAAQTLGSLARIKTKPVLASWMGGSSMDSAVKILHDASIPNFCYADTAARVFNYLWRYSDNLKNIYETPDLLSDDADTATQRIRETQAIIHAARESGRKQLSEAEKNRVFAAYDIPVASSKADVQGDNLELSIGSVLDADFGPVIKFGAGGRAGKVFRDQALAMPPLNATLARRLIQQTKIGRAQSGVPIRRGIDSREIEQALIGFSSLISEQPFIKQCDINPLVATEYGVVALDSDIVLHPPDVNEDDLPRPAIRPYPIKYSDRFQLDNGTAIILRPIRLEDEPLMVKFHETLSEESVRGRYFQLLHLDNRIKHDRLVRVCYTDYEREVALVAECRRDNGEKSILGVTRLSRPRGSQKAEFAVVVSDQWQGLGLGRLMLKRLIDVGVREGIHRIVGHILADNWGMQSLCRKMGFHLRHDALQGEVRATLDLDADSSDSEIVW